MISVSLSTCDIKRRTDAEGQYSFKDTTYHTHLVKHHGMDKTFHF